jgi:hypothetical protein
MSRLMTNGGPSTLPLTGKSVLAECKQRGYQGQHITNLPQAITCIRPEKMRFNPASAAQSPCVRFVKPPDDHLYEVGWPIRK